MSDGLEKYCDVLTQRVEQIDRLSQVVDRRAALEAELRRRELLAAAQPIASPAA